MHSIRRTPECVEEEAEIGACLRHRRHVVQAFAETSGLGPLDMVWCRKRTAGAFSQQERGCFHHVVGYDMVSSACAAAYFADMCANVEKVCTPHVQLECLHGEFRACAQRRGAMLCCL